MNFLVLQHLNIEPPALIADCLINAGQIVEIVHIDKEETIPDALTGYAGLIVMGGPMSANDTSPFIKKEIALLQQAIAQDFPVLGICLGAQLLAKAACAEIYKADERELGWYDLYPMANAASDPLFSLLDGDIGVFQWHGETFTLPEGSALLASCPHVPHQAFRLGSCQYGLQFHVEVNEAIIGQWMDAGESERLHLGKDGIRKILTDSPKRLPLMQSFCDSMCINWLALARKRMGKETPDEI